MDQKQLELDTLVGSLGYSLAARANVSALLLEGKDNCSAIVIDASGGTAPRSLDEPGNLMVFSGHGEVLVFESLDSVAECLLLGVELVRDECTTQVA